jgi:PAS domain S-box-containing protein
MTGRSSELAAQPLTLLGPGALRSVVEESSDCTKLLDLDGRLLYISAGGLRALEADDFGVYAGVLWSSLWPSPGRTLVQGALERARAGERSTFEAQMPTFKGNLRWWSVRVGPVQVEGGAVTQLLAVSRDVTERKEAQQALLALNASLEAQVDQRTAQLEDQARSQDAFMAFTEAVGTRTDVTALAQQAVQVIEAYLPTASAGYYVRTDVDPVADPAADPAADGVAVVAAECWELRVASARVASGGAPGAALPSALSAEHPVIAPVVQTLEPVFYNDWASLPGRVSTATVFGAGAGVPLVIGGETEGVLVVALQHVNVWTGRDQALLSSVGRGLQLALERSEQARRLQDAARAQQAFVAFTEAVGVQTELRALAAGAIEVLRTHMPGVSASVALRQSDGLGGEVWRASVWNEELPEPVVALITRGVPGSHPVIAQMLRTRQPVFMDHWKIVLPDGTDQTDLGQTVAAYPLSSGGAIKWMLSLTLRRARRWTGADRAIVTALGRGLQLALDRAEHSAEVEASNQALIRQQTFLDAVLRSMSESVAACDASEQLTLFSDETRTLHGPEAAGLAGAEWAAHHTIFEPDGLTPMPPERIPLVRAWRGEQLQDAEFVVRAESGAVQHFLASGQPMHAPDGQFLGAVITTRDVSVRKAAERELHASNERLSRLNAELRAANEELEAFAYSASHDLRTPVRHVQSFSELTRRALEPGSNKAPNPAAVRYLGFVEQAAVRMSTLIDAMLLLSRSGRQELRVQPVELAGLLERARQDAELEVSGQRVEWRVAPLPVVSGDPALLLQALSNLITNAVKFSRTREVARIEVWAEDGAEGCSVYVRDNGVGFDPAYSGRLFGVFQRLHAEHEFEGTGVGLATVRRIISRHGGSVWAQGVPGEGATFGFTLPRTR